MHQNIKRCSLAVKSETSSSVFLVIVVQKLTGRRCVCGAHLDSSYAPAAPWHGVLVLINSA